VKKKPETAAARSRILIVDDHPAVREALALRISRTTDLEVCGEAEEASTATRLSAALKPDVVIIDLTLKDGGDGIELIKRINARNPATRMLVWSMHSESVYAQRALRAGASGYITKEQATERIVEAIREVLAGKVYLSQNMTENVLRGAVGKKTKTAAPLGVDSLSDRELEVFRQIGRGAKTKQIAASLHLSVKTIETYRIRIREKLGLKTGAELSHHAILWSLEKH
jgi:DNA-binding NarL/FixJ family response regulator